MFFQSKTSVVPQNIFKNAIHAYRITPDSTSDGPAVVICGVSKPMSKSFMEQFKHDIHIDNTSLQYAYEEAVDIYGNSQTGEFYHNKKQSNSVVVIYKVIDARYYRMGCVAVSKFVKLYEPVIGYSRDGVPITNTDIDCVTGCGRTCDGCDDCESEG